MRVGDWIRRTSNTVRRMPGVGQVREPSAKNDHNVGPGDSVGAFALPLSEVREWRGTSGSDVIVERDELQSRRAGSDLFSERRNTVRSREQIAGAIERHSAGQARRAAHSGGTWTGAGKEAVEELENAWKPAKPVPRDIAATPERMYFSPDGTTVHIGKEWKKAKVGAVFTTGIPQRGQEPEREYT